MVETPTRRSRPRKSTPGGSLEDSKTEYSDASPNTVAKKSAKENGAPASTRKPVGRPRKAGKDPKIDHTGEFEFGGSWGVSAMMLVFPLLMYYMWLGATYFDGKLPLKEKGESNIHFILVLFDLVYGGAFPTLKAWIIYWGFLLFQAACYLYLPGVTTYGKPLEHEGGKRLEYYCSGVWSFYTTIAVAALLHVTGLFKLDTIIDEFGPLMSVAIVTGFAVSIVAYVSALYRGVEHRMTGYPIYDFFMGAELNPRMFGLLDFKMFFEVRLPWYILFLISLGTAARQYEQFGYVTGEVGFLVMAHFLYANACSKGEESIVTTWYAEIMLSNELCADPTNRDMYYEKWGFMLIFWNLAGVPFSYCHCTIYLANHAPSVYHWNPIALGSLYVSYLFVYWVWDTANAQKNRFRQYERGTLVKRNTFPQLPWQEVQNPKTITTKSGDSLLADGWYGYARKIHYTCDLYFVRLFSRRVSLCLANVNLGFDMGPHHRLQ